MFKRKIKNKLLLTLKVSFLLEENETLKFYTVNEDYIDYLSKFDSHVSWNKEQKRPYVGVI